MTGHGITVMVEVSVAEMLADALVRVDDHGDWRDEEQRDIVRGAILDRLVDTLKHLPEAVRKLDATVA